MTFNLFDFVAELGSRPVTEEHIHGLYLTPDKMLRSAAAIARHDAWSCGENLDGIKEQLAAIIGENEQAAELLEEFHSLAQSLSIMSYRQGFLDGYLLTDAE